MISWADFLTLLFALFVLLFATAQRDETRAKQMAASVRQAMGDLRKEKERDNPAPLASAVDFLKVELKDEITAGRIEVKNDPRGVVVTLRDEAFFASGADALYPSAVGSLGKVAEVLRGLSNAVLLEGHTDSVPVHNGRFRSNWDLSSARSIAVMELFVTKFGIPAERFGIAGYADNRPVDGNESAEGRAHNRRVDIVIQNAPK
jgi:chemotaxis protein MotB